MKPFVMTISFVLYASVVSADLHIPTVVFVSGRGLDIYSSVRFSTNGSGCTESNSIYRRSNGKFNTVKAVRDGSIILGVYWIGKKMVGRTGNKTAQRIWDGVGYFGGAWGAKSAVHNFRNCGF